MGGGGAGLPDTGDDCVDAGLPDTDELNVDAAVYFCANTKCFGKNGTQFIAGLLQVFGYTRDAIALRFTKDFALFF